LTIFRTRGRLLPQAAPERLVGYVFFGAQYQSDANVAPGSALIHSPIGDMLLGNQFVKRADVNLFGTGSVLYSYDLGTQNRHVRDRRHRLSQSLFPGRPKPDP
jgi:hypothetical protein